MGTLKSGNHKILGPVKKKTSEKLPNFLLLPWKCHMSQAVGSYGPLFFEPRLSHDAKDHEHLCYVNPFLPASEKDVICEDYSASRRTLAGVSEVIQGIMGIYWEYKNISWVIWNLM